MGNELSGRSRITCFKCSKAMARRMLILDRANYKSPLVELKEYLEKKTADENYDPDKKILNEITYRTVIDYDKKAVGRELKELYGWLQYTLINDEKEPMECFTCLCRDCYTSVSLTKLPEEWVYVVRFSADGFLANSA